ncbi:MAG: hypothetical protein Q8P81_04020 [Nanoarchaeota archaeon]|nr:hypothetical protein [Nanoarchaeota archaeon]
MKKAMIILFIPLGANTSNALHRMIVTIINKDRNPKKELTK